MIELLKKEYTRIFDTDQVGIRFILIDDECSYKLENGSKSKGSTQNEIWKHYRLPVTEGDAGEELCCFLLRKEAEDRIRNHRMEFMGEIAYSITAARFLQAYAFFTDRKEYHEILTGNDRKDRMFRYWLIYKAGFYGSYFGYRCRYQERTKTRNAVWIKKQVRPKIQAWISQQLMTTMEVRQEQNLCRKASDEVLSELMLCLGTLGGLRECVPLEFDYRVMHGILGKYEWLEQLFLLFTEYVTLPEMLGQFERMQEMMERGYMHS